MNLWIITGCTDLWCILEFYYKVRGNGVKPSGKTGQWASQPWMRKGHFTTSVSLWGAKKLKKSSPNLSNYTRMDPRFLRWPIISPNTYVLQRHRQTEYCQCWMKQRKRLQVKYGNEWVWANDKDIRLRIRSSYQRYSVKKRDVKNFVKFTEKHRGSALQLY